MTVLPYTFTLHPDTHQLHTTWEVAGASVSSVCAFGTVMMMEVGYTGDTQELSSGNSWAVNCQPSYQEDNKMEVNIMTVREIFSDIFRKYILNSFE